MVEQFTGFRASDGKPFNDARSAHVHELALFLGDEANGQGNDAVARKLAEAISSSNAKLGELLNIVGTLYHLTPAGPNTDAYEASSHYAPGVIHGNQPNNEPPYGNTAPGR